MNKGIQTKNLFLKLIVLVLGCVSVAQGAQTAAVTSQPRLSHDTQTDFERFVLKFAPPAELRALIEKNKAAIAEKFSGTIRLLPGGLYLKGTEIERIINAERMRVCIQRYNLDLLDVPKKYVYKIGNHWRVFSQFVPAHPAPPMSLKLVQQLAKLAEETGFRDWKLNWRYNSQGKLVCIDTEDNSFAIGMYRFKNEGLPQHCKAQFVTSLMTYSKSMTSEAFEWLKNRINTLMNSPEGTTTTPPIYDITTFDDPGINYAHVKQHLLRQEEQIEAVSSQQAQKIAAEIPMTRAQLSAALEVAFAPIRHLQVEILNKAFMAACKAKFGQTIPACTFMQVMPQPRNLTESACNAMRRIVEIQEFNPELLKEFRALSPEQQTNVECLSALVEKSLAAIFRDLLSNQEISDKILANIERGTNQQLQSRL